MIFKNNRQEVYVTMDQELFMKAKDVLAGEGIDYKTEIVNNNLRAGMGGSAAVSRGGGTKDNYRILVEKKDREKAEYLLRQVP
ncbi:MAG TPA: hypothetical protein DF613_10355 [Lachnospiraceae bacterium]|nr:hypothetical protein [Lachnospiraceae bacterium]